MPGWVETLNGPTGIIAAVGKGVQRTVYCKSVHHTTSNKNPRNDFLSRREARCDWIPVDVAINLILAVGWKTATRPSNTIPVYNCTSGGVNPVTWGYFESVGVDMILKFPMENILWYPGGSFKENKILNSVCEVIRGW